MEMFIIFFIVQMLLTISISIYLYSDIALGTSHFGETDINIFAVLIVVAWVISTGIVFTLHHDNIKPIVNAAIVKCEAELPRNQNCELVAVPIRVDN